jgi:hypothetical protein
MLLPRRLRLVVRVASYATGLALATLPACQGRDHGDAPRSEIRSPEPRTIASSGEPPAIGTADPIRLVASAASGRWVVACQARVDSDGDGRTRVVVGTDSLDGDDMVPYLFRGGGDGEAIDGWIARSPDDRWLLVLRGGALTLIDDATGTVSVVTDAEVPPYRHGLRGLATLDGESKRLAYVRRGTGSRVVVVRDLEQVRERVVKLARPVTTLIADRQGTWAAVWLARETPRVGIRTRPPALREAARGETCQSWEDRAPDVTGGPPDAWLRLDTGARELGTSTLGHVGGATIAKTDDGAIRVGIAELVPASCGAEVTFVSAAPLRLVVACRARAGAPLELYGPGVQRKLADHAPESDGFPLRVLDAPLFCTGSGCFAFANGARIAVRGAAWLDEGTEILSKDGDQLFVTDAATGVGTLLRGVAGDPRAGGPRLVRTRDIVVLGNQVIRLAQARVLGAVPGLVQAVDTTGRALIAPDVHDPERGEFALGPLRWVTPSPAP